MESSLKKTWMVDQINSKAFRCLIHYTHTERSHGLLLHIIPSLATYPASHKSPCPAPSPSSKSQRELTRTFYNLNRHDSHFPIPSHPILSFKPSLSIIDIDIVCPIWLPYSLERGGDGTATRGVGRLFVGEQLEGLRPLRTAYGGDTEPARGARVWRLGGRAIELVPGVGGLWRKDYALGEGY